MEEKVEELVTTIEACEINEETLNWMHEIASPEFGLVNALIAVFLQEIEKKNFQQSNAIIRSLL